MTPTQTPTLADFLLARIAEDEAVARDATEGDGYRDWDVPTTGIVQLAGDDLIGLTQTTREAAHHIARHDPARVLAECEAKRRIVEEYVKGASRDVDADWGGGWEAGLETACEFLALPYADHELFREEWRV